ncbi:MAG: ABC transporter permease [Candidatus Binatia bacterium]
MKGRSSHLYGFCSVLAGIVFWQIGYNLLSTTVYFKALAINLFLASPLQIAQSFTRLLSNGELLTNAYASFTAFSYGYFLAVVVGIPLGLLMASFKKINYYLDPWASFLYATPRVALAPVLIIWFGLGIFSKALIVFLGAVFPILLNTYTGIKSVRENLIEVIKAFGGSTMQVFFKVMIPDALPAIIAGLRLAVGRAVIGVVVAEWFGAEAGLGNMVYVYSQVFRPAPVFVGILVLIVFGNFTFVLLEWFQRWVSPWSQFQAEKQMGEFGMD